MTGRLGREWSCDSASGAALCSLLVVFALLSLWSARNESVTVDEFRHLSTGVYYWQTGDFSFDGAAPPLWKLALALPARLAGAQAIPAPEAYAQYEGWAPWFMATDFMRVNAASYARYLASARIVNVLAACGCLALLYLHASRRFGCRAALFGTTTLAFSPTLLAHSHYATTDVVAMLTLFLLALLLVRYDKSPTWPLLAGAAALFGLSLLCKFTAVVMLPPLMLLAALRPPPAPHSPPERRSYVAASLSIMLVSAVVMTVIYAVYGVNDLGGSVAAIEPRSRLLQVVAGTPSGTLPLPFPRAFVAGFDNQKADSEQSEFPSYLRGVWSEKGFWDYYPTAFGLKETLPFLCLIVLAVASAACRAGGDRGRLREALLFWYLPATLLIVLCLMNRLNVGIRYLLPLYPFLAVAVSRLYADWSGRSWARILLWVALALHVASTVRGAPHFTAYFNELAGGGGNGRRFLIDSNLDWGQDLPGLKRYMAEQGIGSIQLAYFGHALPEQYGVRYEPLADPPKPGYAAVSATLLQGQPYLLTYLPEPVFAGFDYYGFMRSLQPTARIGNSIFVYRISP